MAMLEREFEIARVAIATAEAAALLVADERQSDRLHACRVAHARFLTCLPPVLPTRAAARLLRLRLRRICADLAAEFEEE